MLSSRWKKVINDLVLFKSRSILVIFAIVLGVTGLGVVVTAYSILQKDLNANFLNTNPQSAIITTQQEIPDALVEQVKKVSTIENAELRKKIVGRVLQSENKWIPLILFVVKDFESVQIATFALEQGAYPGENQIMLERDGFPFLDDVKMGNTVEIMLPFGKRTPLQLSGKVHDPGQAPAHMDHVVYGYISEGTYRNIEGTPLMNQLSVIPSVGRYDKAAIERVTNEIKILLEKNGNNVEKIHIPPPGQHPHQWQLNSLIFLLGSIGLLAFVLSSVLVINIISFLLGKQIRQIGMMKSVGATRFQIMKLYYLSVLLLSSFALILATPLSIYGGKFFTLFVAKELNFNILTETVPFWVYIVLSIIGIVFPLLAATVPILKGTRISPREALADYGISKASTCRGLAWIESVGFISPTTKLSLKNTFRQKWRTILTVGTLALGFALFMVSLNVRESLKETLQVASQSQQFDISYNLSKAYPLNDLQKIVSSIDGVKKGIYWKGEKASIAYKNGMKSNVFNIVAPKLSDNAVNFPILDGVWLNATGENEIVINNMLHTLEPDLKVGKYVSLNVNDAIVEFKIIGISREFGLQTVYMSDKTFTSVFPEKKNIENVFIVADQTSVRSIAAIDKDIERVFEGMGISVYFSLAKTKKLQLIQDHLNILTFMVLAGSILALIVGGLGLISTMNINIMERTREIGVMRAIGAATSSIQKMILIESIVIGALSLIAGFVASVPMSIWVADFLGMLIFEIELDFAISLFGSVLAVILMIVFIKTSVFSPNKNMTKLYVREALSYE